MRSKCLTGLLAGALISSLGVNPGIAAEKSSRIAAYVKADSQNGNVKGDVIEIVREAAGREDARNGQSGAGKRRNNEKGMSGAGKRENGESGMTRPGQRRGAENGTSEPGRRGAPEGRPPAAEEPPAPEDMPEPSTGAGDFE